MSSVKYERFSEALRRGVVLSVTYDGIARLVEVHALGVSRTGREVARVYQVDGASLSGENVGWKLMALDKVFDRPRLTHDQSQAPRPGYQKGDLGMVEVFEEI